MRSQLGVIKLPISGINDSKTKDKSVTENNFHPEFRIILCLLLVPGLCSLSIWETDSKNSWLRTPHTLLPEL